MTAAWDLAKRELNRKEAAGRDASSFYFTPKGRRSPLLRSIARARDKWGVVHAWLTAEGHVRS